MRNYLSMGALKLVSTTRPSAEQHLHFLSLLGPQLGLFHPYLGTN